MYKNLSAVSIVLMLASCTSGAANTPAKPNNIRAEEKINHFTVQVAQVDGSKFTQKIEWSAKGTPELLINGKKQLIKGNYYIFTGEVGKIYTATLKCGINVKTKNLGQGLKKVNTKKTNRSPQEYINLLKEGKKLVKEGFDVISKALESDYSKLKAIFEKLEEQLEKDIEEKYKKEYEKLAIKLEAFKNCSIETVSGENIIKQIKEIQTAIEGLINKLKAKAEKANIDLDIFNVDFEVRSITTSDKSLISVLSSVKKNNNELNSKEFKAIFKGLSKLSNNKEMESVKQSIISSNEIFAKAEEEKRDLTSQEIKILVNNYDSIIKNTNASEYFISKLVLKTISGKLTAKSLANTDSAEIKEGLNEFVLFLKEIGLMDFIKAIFEELFNWGIGSLQGAIHNTKSAEKFRANFAKNGLKNLEILKTNLELAQLYVSNYQQVFGTTSNLNKVFSEVQTALDDINKIIEHAKSINIKEEAKKIQNEIIDFLIKHSKLAQQNVSRFFKWLQEEVVLPADKTFKDLFDTIIVKLDESKVRSFGLKDEEAIALVKIQAADLKNLLEVYKAQHKDEKTYDNLLKLVNQVLAIKAEKKTVEDFLNDVKEAEEKVNKKGSKPSTPVLSRHASKEDLKDTKK